MSEKRLWDRVREAVGDCGHFDRLENNPVPGMFDVNFCINGVEGHIELKFRADVPKREGTAVFKQKGLRDAQILWGTKRLEAGGRLFVLAQVGRMLYLCPGSYILLREFNEMPLTRINSWADWSAGPTITTAEWSMFLNILRRKLK